MASSKRPEVSSLGLAPIGARSSTKFHSGTAGRLAIAATQLRINNNAIYYAMPYIMIIHILMLMYQIDVHVVRAMFRVCLSLLRGTSATLFYPICIQGLPRRCLQFQTGGKRLL